MGSPGDVLGPGKIDKVEGADIQRSYRLKKAADTVRNMICISTDIHRMWGDALFALRPLGYNEDRTKLTLEWHWLPRQMHEFHGEVPIPTTNGRTLTLQQTNTRQGRTLHERLKQVTKLP